MGDWSGKKVVIIGVARQGLALARYLAKHGARLVLSDLREADDLQGAQEALRDAQAEWVLGEHPIDLLRNADLVCLSGGVPLTLPVVQEAQRRGIPLSNDSQIFLETAPCRVVGITGSAGKTTTTTLVGRIAQVALDLAGLPRNGSKGQAEVVKQNERIPEKVWVGGNIGTPLIAKVEEMSPHDLAILELSSFQLELMALSPDVAAILNITPNHIDRHGNMAAYTAAKAHILEYQRAGDAAILCHDDPGAWGLREKLRGRLISFGKGDPPAGHAAVTIHEQRVVLREENGREWDLMSRQDVHLRGDHNLLNVLAACAIAYAAGLPTQAMRPGVAGFIGIPHRLEFIRSWGGADWYNDSIATAPERSMAAINSFQEPLVVLAGGRDKDLSWEDFAALVSQRVDHLILFGEAADKIASSLKAKEQAARPRTVIRCRGMQEAVEAAAHLVSPGYVVLLSPGGTSFDEFRDFEDRGEAFRQWVMELP